MKNEIQLLIDIQNKTLKKLGVQNI